MARDLSLKGKTLQPERVEAVGQRVRKLHPSLESEPVIDREYRLVPRFAWNRGLVPSLARKMRGEQGCDPAKEIVLNRQENLERRKWSRLCLAIPIFVRSRDGEGKDFLEFATAVNISAGGALVAVRRSLPLPAQVVLEIPSPPSPALALQPTSARILRARTLRVTHAEGYHLIGLKFLRPVAEGNGNGRPRRVLRRKVASLV